MLSRETSSWETVFMSVQATGTCSRKGAPDPGPPPHPVPGSRDTASLSHPGEADHHRLYINTMQKYSHKGLRTSLKTVE
jgi:hypothetical protein